MISTQRDTARVVTAIDEVTAYFLQRGGVAPNPEHVLYWLAQHKTPQEIYAMSLGTYARRES